MRRVERTRRRTGAYQWNLFRDLADPDRFLETYLVESWAEHLRQHRRSTESDMVHRRAITQYLDGEASVTHYVSSFGMAEAVEPHV
jgi:quinol monooxygenase YgiN